MVTKLPPTPYDALVKDYNERYGPLYNAGQHPPASYEQDTQVFNLGAQEGYRRALLDVQPLVEALSAITEAVFTGGEPPTSFAEAMSRLIAIRGAALTYKVPVLLAAFEKGGQQ